MKENGMCVSEKSISLYDEGKDKLQNVILFTKSYSLLDKHMIGGVLSIVYLDQALCIANLEKTNILNRHGTSDIRIGFG